MEYGIYDCGILKQDCLLSRAINALQIFITVSVVFTSLQHSLSFHKIFFTNTTSYSAERIY